MLPENWVSPSPVALEDYLHAAEKVAGEAPAPLHVGAQYIRLEDGVHSLGLAFRDGRLDVSCEKLFPSAAVGERGLVRPGRLHGPIEYKGWRVSCIVCVDIFYPELARVYAVLHGSTLILNPSKIPVDRVGLWRSVLLARAAENSVYVAGANAAGERYRDGREVAGGSAVYTPDGRPLVEAGWGRQSLIVELDPGRLGQARSRWAFERDARTLFSGLYRSAAAMLSSPPGNLERPGVA